MSDKVLFEMAGSVTETEALEVSIEEAVMEALARAGQIVDFDDVDEIVTGLNGDVTYALIGNEDEDGVLADLGYDHIDVDAFYVDVSGTFQEDDEPFYEAAERAYEWRNRQVMKEDNVDEDESTVDLAIVASDLGRDGQFLVDSAKRCNVPVIEINLDDLVDRDVAYGGGEEEAESEAEA